MNEVLKSRSPFYPGQPVPAELFVGRSQQIMRILDRGVRQVAMGKPVAMYVQGEYGIGKSSIATFAQWVAERDHALHGIYAPLGGAGNLRDLAMAVVAATLRSGAFDPKRSEKLRNWLAKYVGKQELFGLSLNLDKLRNDTPSLSTHFGMLAFLTEAYNRLKDTNVRGIFLVLDEINGIASDTQFAHFLKSFIDTNAAASPPLPFLLMLCGVEEKRRDLIQRHQPVDRLFDVIDIEAMTEAEMVEFFNRAFGSVQMTVEATAMRTLTTYSAGFPKIMHLVGDAAFWSDRDGVVDNEDAIRAVVSAADDVGKKYVDQQVYGALRSKDYRSILERIAKLHPDRMSFTRREISVGLSESQRKKLDNFLKRMKTLQVIRSGTVAGEYVFNVRMVRLYIWLQSLHEAT